MSGTDFSLWLSLCTDYSGEETQTEVCPTRVIENWK